jgi:hypothetical protein
MTTYNKDTYISTTHTEEIDGPNIRCNSTEIYCNNVDYDCCGNWIFDKDSHNSVTYNKEAHS